MASAQSPVGCVLLLLGLFTPPIPQAADDPTIRAAVERYYKALEAEDIDAYLALWSKTVQPPQRNSVKFLFDFADERFFDIEIVRAVQAGNRLRVQVSMRRERSRPGPKPGAPSSVQVSVTRAAITFVREADDWKVVSEGLPADDLAAAIVAATTDEEREVLLAAEPDLVNAGLVVAIGRIATNAAAMQNYARAQSIFERAVEVARRTGSRKEEGEALQNLGQTLYFQRRFPEALAIYQQRLALEEARGDDAALAVGLSGLATIRYSLAEYTEALKGYRLALAIQERLDDRPSSASSLISIGNIRYLQGDYPGAIRDYTRSRELYRAFAYSDGEARALEGLGRTYLAQGDYVSALTAFAGVLEEGRTSGNRERQGTATQSIAEVHLRLGNIDAARKYYEASRDHFVALKNASAAGRVWQGLGLTELIAGRFDAAEMAYTRSMTICGGAGDAECSAHAVVGLAFAQAQQEKFVEAIASYRKAIQAFTSLGAREPAARAEVGLSQALAGTGQFALAVEAAVRARREAIALDNDDVLWRAQTAEARVLRKSGEPAQAIAAIRAAAGVVERMQERALNKPATAIPSDATGAFATLALLQAETGDPAGASASVARMRAIDLRTTLAVNEREIARGMTPQERDQERIAAFELQSLLAQAARERGLGKPDKSRLTMLDERIAAASVARNKSIEQLYVRLPDLRLWRGLAPVPSAEDLTRAISPGTVILEFVVDEDDVLLIVTSAMAEGGPSAFSMPIRRRALAERVNAMLLVPMLRDPVLWRKATTEIARLLPPQLPALLAVATRVVILPHDILWRVPFEALPIGSGYLGDRTQVFYAGSPTALVRMAALERVPVGTLLVVAAPRLADGKRERLQQTAPGWAIRAGESGEREASVITGPYDESATVLKSEAATEAAVRAEAEKATALHIAAPFRINGAGPLFSPILLAGDGAAGLSADDGSLETREVMNLSLRARTLILSDGAATSMLDGAASADTIQWAWLAAGVPSVLLARWSSDPAASDALLAEFHRRLIAGDEPAVALHRARTTIRKRPEWASPFFWAGWMMLGR